MNIKKDSKRQQLSIILSTWLREREEKRREEKKVEKVFSSPWPSSFRVSPLSLSRSLAECSSGIISFLFPWCVFSSNLRRERRRRPKNQRSEKKQRRDLKVIIYGRYNRQGSYGWSFFGRGSSESSSSSHQFSQFFLAFPTHAFDFCPFLAVWFDLILFISFRVRVSYELGNYEILFCLVYILVIRVWLSPKSKSLVVFSLIKNLMIAIWSLSYSKSL